jgi:hypothetical protein
MRATDPSVWGALPQPFLAREAFAVGLTSTSIAGAVGRRQIIPVARSVYAVPEVWVELDPPELHIAMTRAAWVSVPDAVVSHQSAALRFGLPHPLGPIGRPTVTVPESTRSSARDDWRRVLHAELPPEHVMQRDGVTVTNPARTVLDALRQLRLRDALAIADGAVRAKLVTLAELEEMRRFQTRWPGVRNADQAFGLVDHRRESWLESASVATAHMLGFSRPESQIWIHHTDGRLIGRVDLLWRHAGVVGEADGRGKYLGEFSEKWDAELAAQFMLAERDRERELESVGFAVARWGTGELLDKGRGLNAVLQSAGQRADPRRIRCLWRQDEGDELRPWAESRGSYDSDDEPPHAA